MCLVSGVCSCACASCTEAKYKENEEKKEENWKPTETQISIPPHHALPQLPWYPYRLYDFE